MEKCGGAFPGIIWLNVGRAWSGYLGSGQSYSGPIIIRGEKRRLLYVVELLAGAVGRLKTHARPVTSATEDVGEGENLVHAVHGRVTKAGRTFGTLFKACIRCPL